MIATVLKLTKVGILILLAGGISTRANAQPVGERVGSQLVHVFTSAYAAAMGDASVAFIETYSGFGSNPATLGFIADSKAEFSSTRLRKGEVFDHIGVVYKPAAKEVLAANFDILHFGGVDFYTDATVRRRGFESRWGVSYGRMVGSALAVGFNLQALNATTDVQSSWGLTTDIGLLYAPSRYIRYGLTLKGLGSSYDVRVPILPTDVNDSRVSKTLAMGLLFDLPSVDREEVFRMAVQNEKIFGEALIIYRVGMEYARVLISDLSLSFRTGFVLRGSEFEPRWGVGVRYSKFSVDYGYRYSRRDAQPSHAFSASVSF